MRSRCLALFMLVCAGTGLAAKAPPPRSSPLAEVKKELAAGEFERALKKIEAALKKTTNASEQAQLLLSRAEALLALGTADKAKAAFSAALQRDATVELDATRASPDAVKLFEKARAELPATLAIAVSGGEANVSIDDKDLGPAPLTLQLEGGKHVVDAKGSAGLTAHRELTLVPGRKVALTLELAMPEPERQAATQPPLPPALQPPPLPPLVTSTTAEAPPSARSPVAPWVVVGIGGAALVAGAIVTTLAGVEYGQAQNATFRANNTWTVVQQTTLAYRTNIVVGPVLLGAGAALAVGGIVWRMLSGTTPPVALTITSNGLIFAGTL